jgi:hypothetical protein
MDGPRIRLDDDLLTGRFLRLVGSDHERRSFGVRIFLGSIGLLWGGAALLAGREDVFWPGGLAADPFAHDLSMLALFWLALPVLLASGPAFSRVQNRVLEVLRGNGVFALSEGEYAAAVDDANASLANPSLHGIFLVAAWLGAAAWAYSALQLQSVSWHGLTCADGTRTPSWALIYVALVPMPLFIYAIAVWSYKALVWNWFVHRVTRAGLRVDALHPDGAAGLGVFRYSALAWGSYILCVGFAVGCDVFNYYYLTTAPSFRWDVILKLVSYLVIAPVVFLAPVLSLVPHLVRARAEGEVLLSGYGRRYADELAGRLRRLRDGEDPAPPSVIQEYWSGMCDFRTVYDAVANMRVLPLDLGALARMAATVAAPLLPLIAAKVPFVARFLERLAN